MKISLIQTSLAWEDHEANRQNFSKLISQIEETDLIILPEMFATGFTMNPQDVFETMEGQSVQWMKDAASQKNCAVTGSVVIKEGDNYYNRLLFVFPDGKIETYNKRHLFSLAGEDKVYTAGKDRLVVEYKGWKICPLICYDLRFPVFSRNTEDIDLLIYVANWPERRVFAWDSLLRARAIENMCYVAGVNRIGQDNNGHTYTGHSQVYDCLGQGVGLNGLIDDEDNSITTIALNKDYMKDMRSKLSFLNDRDAFILQD